MGGTTKFKFPIPHRRPKEKTHEVQSISAPMTNKASKLLGAAEINIDTASPISSTSDQSRLWETHSAVSGVSGISVTISETTASGSISRSRSPLSTVKESPTAAPARTNARLTWEQESDIIPRGLGVGDSNAARSHNPDTTTDASSLRRRRSSSTIISYYDKTKLPLSISQQTANSAIAKGLPDKAWELLDMDSPRPAPAPPKPERKKPNRLDLTHLLPNAGASSRKAFTRLTQRGSSMVLGPDLMTRSPSFMSSSSPVSSPSECEPKPEKGLRRKLTKESLRSLRGPRPERASVSGPEIKNANLRKRATDTGTLYNLYQHYEDTSFRDTPGGDIGQPSSGQSASAAEPAPPSASRPTVRQSVSIAPPPLNNKPRHHVSPSLSAVTRQAYSVLPQDHTHTAMSDPPVAATNAGLASLPAEYAASVSSRHTRTSKASKRTDQSFTDFDPNTTSVLSLSSDSEDDDAEPPRTALSIPSVTSLDSVSSPLDGRRPSSTSSQEPVRKHPKSKFRPSMNAQGQFLAIPENMISTTTTPPPINPRTSSLVSSFVSATSPGSPQPGAAPSSSTTASLVRSPSRLSQVSTSTSESIASQISRPHPSSAHLAGPRQAPEVHHIAMLQSRAVPTGIGGHHGVVAAKEIKHSSPRTRMSPRVGQPTPPMSPSGMEHASQNHHGAAPEHGGPILTLSSTGSSEDERFMAVTRQEELLLAALRAKRARMRESHQIAEQIDAELDNGQDGRKALKKESLSSIKTVKAQALQPPPASLHASGTASGRSDQQSDATTMLFPKPPSTKPSSKRPHNSGAKAGKHEQVLLYLSGTTSEAHGLEESNPELRDFLAENIERFHPPESSSTATASTSKPSHSCASSAAAVAGSRMHPRAARQSRTDHGSTKNHFRHASEYAHNKTGQDPRDAPHHNITPVPERPESPSSHYEEDSQIEQQPEEPRSRARKKAARISAVGMLPEWGDDG
ncbi:hypothetical protein KVR01_005700 [Diaporthe batatas]|uniref:uncharacterized protein n=1 Tax=Diaporthe batatas TaxID=748121 RepID=UPI001D056A80|nr:uncharacterized protein KVR01_005700 [Diaporthe batatas]KAG8165425.1 hypothetical protein KVR01_005700 [Diaporthe batatas]